MKKLPLTIIPLLVVAVIVVLFTTIVPKNGDLISPSGDNTLGQIVGALFVICLVIDARRFRKNKL